MKRPTPADVDRLRMEHEAMASTLCEAENHVPEDVMKHLRRHYAAEITAAREYAEAAA